MDPLSLDGQTLGKYRVLAPLGAGGMARVYRAYHPQLNRYVAIKVLRHDLSIEPEFLTRFSREAQSVAALRHPNIVQVFDFDVQDNMYYMVMELLEGDSLKERLHDYNAHDQKMPPDEAARILIDTLAGLGYAHDENVIHRDLKPANLMLTKRGQAVLTDFGIAQIVGGPKQTVTGTLMGTLNYMAPEQGLQGKWDRRSDLYSIGVVLYEMLTGRVPFDADTPLAILMKHVNEPLPLPSSLNPAIPDSFERLLLKALSKDPDDRFQTAPEMKDAILTALREGDLTLPDRVPPPLASADPTQPVGVYSGADRAAITNAGFANDDTDITLDSRLTPSRTPVAKTRPAIPKPDEVQTRGMNRAVFLGVGSIVAVNLISFSLGGAMGDIARFMSYVWPIEIFSLVFFLSLLMEAMAIIYLVIPVGILFTVSLLLDYYVLSGHWNQWYFWPLYPLVVAVGIVSAIAWASPSPRIRGRQLGLVLSILSGSAILLGLVGATILSSR